MCDALPRCDVAACGGVGNCRRCCASAPLRAVHGRGTTSERPRVRPADELGLAVDLGTTRVAVYLCHLESGAVLNSMACDNPQLRFGADVVSRISVASRGWEMRRRLQQLAVTAVDGLAERCLENAGARKDQVRRALVVGNTTMLHLLAGIDPAPLGRYPFQPVSREAQTLPASDLSPGWSRDATITLFPVVSGFVGGDAVAAAMAADLHHCAEPTLLVDIGTNGEVLLASPERLWATSCATGPALEGAGISCGMRAVAGAIHRAEVDERTGQLRCHVLGPAERATGVCGSGLVDVVAALRRLGHLGRDGLLVSSTAREIPLSTGQESAVTLTLRDIAQVQLAKAALASGVRLLLRRAGVARTHRTLITGAFGASLEVRSVRDIGLLPSEALAGEVSTLDNLAGAGAVGALCEPGAVAEAAAIAARIQVLDLATDPEFADAMADATWFPSLEEPRCPS